MFSQEQFFIENIFIFLCTTNILSSKVLYYFVLGVSLISAF